MSAKADKIVEEAYYMTPEMIQFLVIENLALKNFLHKKGLLNPEEYHQCQLEAATIVKQKLQQHIEEWKKTNPQFAKVFDQLEETLSSQNPQTEDHAAAAST